MNNSVRSLRPWRRQRQNAHARNLPAAGKTPGRPAVVLEAVEPRVLFASFVVTTVADDGAGSLRQAIRDANAAPGVDDISFNIPGATPAVKTINLASPLEPITDVVTIDGTTQPGYEPDPNVPATPVIELNGAAAGATANGLTIASSDPGLASNIVGLAINRFGGNGILITGDGNFVAECSIGTNPAGTAAGPGNGGHGVLIDGGDNNFIAENTIAFNAGDGIALVNGSTGNDVDLNSFFSNGGIAVDFNNDGVTANDAGDADTGVNTLQNAPVLTNIVPATGGGLTVTGTINTTPNTLLAITLYNGAGATEGEIEGQNIQQTIEVTTNAAGVATFTETIATAAPTDWVTATATAIVFSGDFATINGSEFSNAIRVNDNPIAHVTNVFVNGQGLTSGTSANAVAFRNLAGIDGTYGYPVPAGTTQTRSIPWNNGINQVAIRFDTDVAGRIDQGDLSVRGINTPTYTPSAFSYDPATRTAVWTLPAAVTNDKLRLVLDDAALAGLDGEWAGPVATESFPSGDGTVGGDFDFRVNVLRGDATQDGVVNALDISFIKQRLNRTATNPGTIGAVYSVFGDITADGSINALDLSAAKQRLNNRLPTGEPAATALLFSSEPISA